MTLEEIVKQEGRQPDCSGYVTKYDIECSDGLTIRQGAFNDDNGRRVPMVWMHDHKDMENVLGHIYLESRDDGVYGYGFFNDSPKGQLGKLYVDHGDISSFSIYANKLKKKARDVVHGMIREVSLVLAGANRGAIIDSPISHSDQDEDEADGVICMGDDYGGPIYGNDEPLSVEEYLEHYGRKGMKWGKNLFKTEYEAHPREKGEEKEEETGNKKKRAEEEFAASKKLNGIVNDIKNYKGNTGNGLIKLHDELCNAFEEYCKVCNMNEDEIDEFALKFQEKLDKLGVNEDIASIYNRQKHQEFLDSINNAPPVKGESLYGKIDYDKIQKDVDDALDKQDQNMVDEKVEKQDQNKKKTPREERDEMDTRARETAMIDDYHKMSSGTNVNVGIDVLTAQLKWYFENEIHDQRMNGKLYTPPSGFISEYRSLIERAVIGQSRGYAEETIKERKRELELAGIESGFLDNVLDNIEFPKTTGEKLKDTAQNVKNEVSDSLNSLKDKVNELLDTPILTQKTTIKTGDDPDNLEVRKEYEKEIIPSINEMLDDTKKKLKDLFKHSDLSDEEAEDIIKHYISGELTMDDILEHAENEGGKTVREVFEGMSDEQQSLVVYFLKKARQLIDDGEIKHSEKEEDEMKHNVFDDAKETKENTISHADMEKLEADVFKDAKSKGSLKDAFLAHADDYGIDNIEWLFPEDRNLNNPPAWIKRPDGWVSKVMKGVHHSPFSRIKSVFADITEPDARARGYMKGNRKVEEVFGLLKRSTSPTTVYKKQKLDRDDIVDITDFDVVSWLKTEMRGMLDEELARAFLVSDGRSPASNDKINEQNIRPIWTDDDLFVIRKPIAVTSSTTTDEKCKQFIRSAIKARKDYKGSGNPTLFTTDDLVSDLMLMEDQIGHPLYETMEKLTAKLRVKEIVTVPVMENLTRTSGTMTFELMGIIVNLDDYNVGADKGGAVSMFEDFDIDYNQEKYLIETRCSGALTKPYSAIVIESTSSIYLDVDPDDPTETRYSKAVSTLQSDVVVNDDSIGGTLKYVTGYTGYSEDTDLQSGNYLSLAISAPTGATTTVKMVNNGGVNETESTLSNDYYVAYVKSKNAKIVVTTTLSGVSMTKTYSLRLLKLEKA